MTTATTKAWFIRKAGTRFVAVAKDLASGNEEKVIREGPASEVPVMIVLPGGKEARVALESGEDAVEVARDLSRGPPGWAEVRDEARHAAERAHAPHMYA